MTKNALLSPDQVYRYTLIRHWGEDDDFALFVGLNPSTADAELDDPTIRRCISFAQEWGMDGLVMVNLFAFRATDPRVMKAAADPVGNPYNDFHIDNLARQARAVVAAWGAHGTFMDRDKAVMELLRSSVPMKCLGTTKSGCPKHPLYLAKKTPLEDYRP